MNTPSLPLMLDIDLAQTRFLSGVELASNGAALARFAVPKSELLLDRRFILQAVGWSPMTGGILLRVYLADNTIANSDTDKADGDG